MCVKFVHRDKGDQMDTYQQIFESLDISDPILQKELTLFVEKGVCSKQFGNRIDKEVKLQSFVEQVFAARFAPFQEFVQKFKNPANHPVFPVSFWG